MEDNMAELSAVHSIWYSVQQAVKATNQCSTAANSSNEKVELCLWMIDRLQKTEMKQMYSSHFRGEGSIDKDEYSAFTTWLLGQLVFILSNHDTETVLNGSVGAQIFILESIFSRNPRMFIQTISFYLNAIEDLLTFYKRQVPFCVLTDERSSNCNTSQTFKWFLPNVVNTLPDCFIFEQFDFIITSKVQCAKLLNQLLKVLAPQVFSIINLCEDLWPLILNILNNCNEVNVRLTTLDIVIQLLQHGGYSSNNSLKNDFAQILEQLLKQMCTKNHSLEGDKSWINIMNLLNQIAIMEGLGSNSKNMSLLNTLFTVINNENISSYPNKFLISLCDFIKYLLDITPEFYENTPKLDTLFSKLPCCPHLFMILEYIFLKKLNLLHIGEGPNQELEADFSSMQKIDTKTIYNTNAIWNKALSTMEENVFTKIKFNGQIFDDDSHLSHENNKSLRLLYFFCKTISSLSFEIGNRHRIALLNGKLEDILKCVLYVLLKETEVDGDLLADSFFILNQVVTVSGINNEPSENIHLLAAFLSLPWILDEDIFSKFSYSIDANYLDSLRAIGQKYQKALSAEDLCGEQLKNLSYFCNNVCFQWRFTLYQIFSNDECFQRIVFESLPFMIFNCRASNYLGRMSQFLHSIIESCKASPKTHEEFSRVLPSIICALSFDCNLGRGSDVKLRLNCRTCKKTEVSTFSLDEESKEISEALRLFISQYYSDFIIGFMKESHPDNSALCSVRKNIISSISCLTNHVSKNLCKDFLFRSMQLMNDSDSDTRHEFAKVVKYTIFSNRWLKSVRSNKSCLKKWSLLDIEVFKDAQPFYDEFKRVCYQAIASSLQRTGKNKQVSVMETLLNVGSVPCDCFLWSTIKMLMHYVAHPCKKDIYLSSCYIRQIVTAHNMNMDDFLKRYEGEILEEIIFQVVVFKKHFGTSMEETLSLLSSMLAYEMPDLIDYHGPNMYKYLFRWVSRWREYQPLLQELAQLSKHSIENLIIGGFREIYPIILLYQPKENSKFCCSLIEQFSGIRIPELLRRSFIHITATILVHYSVKPEEAEEALLEIKRYDDKDYPEASNKKTEIAEFLQFRFLGLLGELEDKLTSITVADSIKGKILCSLPGIFNLMGSEYITSVRFKVLVTLCTGLTLQRGSLPSLCIEAWLAFVNIVEISALGPMLSTIFVSLNPLINDYPAEIANIFYYLICENEEELSSFFGELYFLEDHHANPLVYKTVQKYLQPNMQMSTAMFRRLLKHAAHERAEVRLQAFNRLKSDLDFYHDEISKMILSSDSLDPLIIEILETLTVGSHDSDEEVRIACGKCFGELGAIDPGLLPNKLSNSDLTKNMPLKVDSESAIIHLLTTLCQGFQSAKLSRSQDEFALAIQELLRIFKVQENSELLSSFPENFRELMKPLFKSTYKRKEMDSSEVNLPFPIFGSSKGKSFQSWAFNWINHLVSLTADQKIKDIFKNCKGSMKMDESTIRAFLPFIVVNAIIESNDMQRRQIYEELDCVMSNSGAEFLLSNSNKSALIGFARQFIKPEFCQNFVVDTMNEFSANAETCSILCGKVVYGLIDFLFQYTRDDSNQTKSEDRKIITEFLNLFSKEKIAEKSFAFDEFPRALLYLEQYVSENPVALQMHLPLLGKIYAQLNDADALQGIVAIHTTEPSAEEMLLMHEVNGGLSDAIVCYEKLAQKNDNNPVFYKSMVQCYLRIDQPFTALKVTDNLINTSSDFEESLLGDKVEAIWSMMMFDQLEVFLSKPSLLKNESLGTRMGVAMLHVLHNEQDKMLDEIRNIFKIITHSLYTSTLVSGGYREGYEYVIKLHILNEVEQLSSLVLSILSNENSNESEDIDRLKMLVEKKFNKRLRLLQPLGNVLQPVLRMRRVMLSIGEQLLTERKKQVASFFRNQIGKCLLKSIKIARKASNFQMAYSNILEVEKYKPKELFIEKAQLLWAKKEINQALATLNRGIEIHFSSPGTISSEANFQEEKRIHAKAKLLIACYNEETSNIDPATNTKYFMETVSICDNIEKSYVRLAQFQDKTAIAESLSYIQIPEKLDTVIRFYGKSMLFGCKYLYQSMSKVLSLWLDFGAELSKDVDQDTRKKRNEPGPSSRKNLNTERREKALKSIISTIGTLLERLPTFMFLAAFSQLTSRICHPDNSCFVMLKAIIIKCILAYPSQTLWMFMCLHKSVIPLRMKRFTIVLNDSRLQGNRAAMLIPKFKKLFEIMSALCEKTIDGKYRGKTISCDKFFPELMSEFAAGTFHDIMIPFQKFRTLALPRPVEEDNFSLLEHKPFPDDCIYMFSVKKEVSLLCSLQVPKKLTIIGSDGNEYSVLCKPKDDLRLDFRLMEFNSIVNMFLKRDGEARDRDLHIRTYSVAPLINDCGLIEWVPNLMCLRPILNALWKSKNIALPNAEVKKRIAAVKDPMEKKLDCFRYLKKHHPPVLKEWFFKTFPNPCAWYLARLAYIRTLAVMSIVGFIVGLGDRHTENILLDYKCGEIIHVDFNCLFNKGELFDYKEVVPFRLTHNLVDTMGPTGTEGVFVRCCEITNRIMRAHRQLLVSVLTPFVYDPLLCWKGSRDGNLETVNTEAKNHINNIECRLKGSVKKKDGKYDDMQLSIEGQVRSLIHEATLEDNLAQMFPGWGPYM